MSFLGQIDLMPTEEPGVVEVGFILHSEFQNQGFCSEALKAFLFEFIAELASRGYKSNQKKISEVIATAHPENDPSNAVLKKAGMNLIKFKTRFSNPRLWYSFLINLQPK